MSNFDLGTRAAVVGQLFPSELKQQLLLFDKIVVLDLDDTLHKLRKIVELSGNPHFSRILQDLDFCAEKGLVLDVPDTTFSKLSAQIGQQELSLLLEMNKAAEKAAEPLRKYVEKKKPRGGPVDEEHIPKVLDWFQQQEIARNVAARIVAEQIRFAEAVEAAPVFSNDFKISERPELNLTTKSSEVASVVLNKIPLPDNSVPWEKILEFRADETNSGFLQGLRVWMQESLKQSLSASELTEKLEWLVYQREEHFRLHKMSQNTGSLSALFVASMEILEDLSRLKLGAAAKGLVSMANRKAELLKLEFDGPAREVGYVIRVNKAFPK